MSFRIDLPLGITQIDFCTDALAQLGPRAFSTRAESDGVYIEGELSQSEASTLLSGIVARKTATAQDATATRTAVQNALAGIPGTAWTALTAAQKQAVIVALLFKVGALDKTLTVQPLANWL